MAQIWDVLLLAARIVRVGWGILLLGLIVSLLVELSSIPSADGVTPREAITVGAVLVAMALLALLLG
jgi:hypothetical protein